MHLPLELIDLLARTFCLGVVAAAPTGPVNIVAIHRGILGRWTHTLACGAGAAIADLSYFTLALWSGQSVAAWLDRPGTRQVLACLCAAVLIPMGVVFLVRGLRGAPADKVRGMFRLRTSPPRHLWTDVGTGLVFTALNPAAPAYWVAVTAGSWGTMARTVVGENVLWWGLPAAAAGLIGWFALLAFLVRFAPQRLGQRFFRIVSTACGSLLLISAVMCVLIAFVG